MPENKKMSEEMYVEPTVEVSGEVVDPLSPAVTQSPSITVCGCCLC
jgi:hypothetical protein